MAYACVCVYKKMYKYAHTEVHIGMEVRGQCQKSSMTLHFMVLVQFIIETGTHLCNKTS